MELPHVNPQTCTGCGDCAAICPTDCLGMANQIPWLPRPADCIQCDLCVLICPVDAIAMKQLVSV